MKKLLLVLTLAIVSISSARAQDLTKMRVAYDHEDLTVDNTVRSFDTTKVRSGSNQANLATFTVDCVGGGTVCPIRILTDGNDPTTSVGQLLDYGMSASSYGLDNNVRFKAIRTTSTSAILHIIYHR